MSDLRTKPLDLIYARGVLTAESLASEVRSRLSSEIAKRHGRYSQWELIDLAKRILSELEPILAENLAATDLAGYLLGLETVASKLPEWALPSLGRGRWQPPIPPPGFPPPASGDEPRPKFPLIEKAVESLESRNIVTREQFDQLTDVARGRAFTVAGDISAGTIGTIRDVLADTVSEGTSLVGFRERLGDSLERSFLGPGHLETVYRTNVQASFHDGGEALASDPIVRTVLPFREYLPIHDARVRSEHLALGSMGLDGTGVYWADDPFWEIFTPPVGYNCRCGTNYLTISKAASKGVLAAQEWLRTGREPVHESRLIAIPFRPQAGWSRRRVAA